MLRTQRDDTQHSMVHRITMCISCHAAMQGFIVVQDLLLYVCLYTLGSVDIPHPVPPNTAKYAKAVSRSSIRF